MKSLSFLILLFCIFFNTQLAFSQVIKGKIFDADSGSPIVNVQVNLNDKAQAITGSDGSFLINKAEGVNLTLSIDHKGYSKTKIDIAETQVGNVNLGIVFLEKSAVDSRYSDANNIIDVNELDAAEDDFEVSSLLSAAWDPFGSKANFNFSGTTRYIPRGLSQEQSLIYLNNLPFNNLDNGRFFWSLWGGLNDVWRTRYSNHGLNVTDFSIGGTNGSMDIDLRAISQRKQTRASLSFSNRSYTYRAMLTHSSGLTPSGFSYSFSLSRRWGNGGYAEGTYYDAYSYFGSVEKKFNDKHSLGLVVFAAPTIRGRASGSTQIMYDLVGDNFYNPNWGYQNGKVRNSREYRNHQPVGILRHDFKLNEDTKITSSAGFQTGRNGSTRLDWLSANDPRPDYYRNLPYENLDNQASFDAISEKFQSDPSTRQLDWDRMIGVNRERLYTIQDPEGNDANNTQENVSAYIVEEQRFDQDKFVFQSNIISQLNKTVNFKAGVEFIKDQNKNFKVVDDLLGGSYYLDIDDFALRDFPDDYTVVQNDINNPNRLLSEGDVFGYNYIIHNQRLKTWASSTFTLSKFDFFLAGSVGLKSFWREGLVQNGKFPDDSFGTSEKQNFTEGNVKGGLTYKIDGRNYVYANASYMSLSPVSRDAYLAPRIRNEVVNNLENQTILGGEIGYVARYPNVNARITGYFYDSNNDISQISFYHDELRSFVNLSLSNIDRINYGLELGADFKLSQVFEIGVASSLGEFYYDSRFRETAVQNNTGITLIDNREVFSKGANVDGMPQVANSLELKYSSPHFWRVALTANYFSDIFLAINPDRRTSEAVDGITRSEQPDLWNEILAQEKYPSAFVLNLFGNKSFKIKDSYLNITMGINNLLDKTDFRIGGFEQLRFDYAEKDVNRFAPKYYYAYGRTYFVNVSYSL